MSKDKNKLKQVKSKLKKYLENFEKSVDIAF